jgi:hypothetical protein
LFGFVGSFCDIKKKEQQEVKGNRKRGERNEKATKALKRTL